jgi:protease-4
VRQPAKGFAGAQELRDAIVAFRGSGKFAIAHAETFGEVTPANGAYYVASGCDEIWLQPSGDVGLVGVAVEVNFLRGALDKLGVLPQLDHRHEFKNAKNRITDTAMTPAYREATGRLVEALFGQVVAAVAGGRGLDEAAVRDLIDRGPVLGGDALDAGLVDRLAYRDELADRYKDRTLTLASYAKRSRPRRRRAATVAVIHGDGEIVLGRSRPSLLTRSSMGSDTIGAAFRAAAEDKRVKAILFRVDSPGGSAVASDAIRRESERARAKGKPVVVSMGDVAGSGGYYVALAADRVVAQPATITGSIGVVGGKAVLAGLKQKLGLSSDEVHAGRHALISSVNHPYTESEWARLQALLDRVYDDFVGKVAEGRDLPVEKVREVAKGRIWAGADAVGLGLVDELGGYPAAMRSLRDLLGLAASAPLRIVTFPRRRPALLQALGARPAAALDDLVSGPVALRMPDLPFVRW